MIGNGRVIGSGVLVGSDSQVETGLVGGATIVGAHFLQDSTVVTGIDDDSDEAVILGRSPDHGGAADIDILDGIFQCAVLPGHGLFKGVQVDDHHIDGADAVLGHDLVIDTAAGENAAVYLRVQGFHAAVHHFRETGVSGDLRDLNAILLEQAKGAAGGQQLDIHFA